MVKLDYNQARKVHKLIRKECCNCVENNCVLMDDVCVQLISQHNIYCNYFLRAVLPLDKNLSAELLSENAKRCEVCGKYFTAFWNYRRVQSDYRLSHKDGRIMSVV